MKTELLVIQNSPTASLGVLEECIRDRDVAFKILAPSAGERLSLKASYDGLIVLGGPMNAEDDANYPHLKDVVSLIQLFAKENKPILGICLGAQLIARAFGSRVYRHDVVELGFTTLRGIDSAIESDPLLNSALPATEPIQIMQWHFDTFDLPEKATLLMTGDRCINQAYRINDNIYGFQCHFEVNRSILQSWLNNGRDYIQSNHPNFPQQLAIATELHLNRSRQFCDRVGNAWLDLIQVSVVS